MHIRTVQVTYSENIVRDAVRTFVWRRIIVGQKALWVAEAAMVVFLVWLLWKGEQGWLVGVVGVAVIIALCLPIVAWIAHYRNTVGKFRRMSSRRADFTFLDEGFEIVSELGAAKIPWSTVTEIWERSNYWMIFTAPNQFMTLPVETVSLTDRKFLRSKIPSALSRKSYRLS